MTPGKIRIVDNVVKFEPDGLEKPKQGDYCIPRNDCTFRFYRTKYGKALKEYEASKQLIEVSNVSNLCKNDIIKNSFCKAEITDKTCIIIELIKK